MSRQLWWGHRIPVWYIEGSDEAEYVVARCEEDAYESARSQYGPDVKLIQESDVLDTWFSRYETKEFLHFEKNEFGPFII